MTLYTCKVQNVIIIYIFTLTLIKNEKKIFKQIYIINNIQN